MADDILVVESDNLESITHLAQKFNAEQQNNRALFSMGRVGKSKLLELVNSYVSMMKEAFPDADFNYLLWDKKVRSFQIKRKIYHRSEEAYLDVICYKEREVLPDLDKTELMHCW